MIAANSALRRALRTVRFAKLLIDFPLQFWCSFEPLHLHILLLYRMALWQVAEDLAEEVDTSALIGTGPPFTAKGLYWRLDTHSVESFDFPVLVFHLNQAVVCKLFFHSARTDDDLLWCVVDLPDNVLLKDGHKPGPLVKYIGKGKTIADKLESLKLHQLVHTHVLNEEGNAVPGFPYVVLQLHHKQCTGKNAVGCECHQSWTPTDEAFQSVKLYYDAYWEGNDGDRFNYGPAHEKAGKAHKHQLLPVQQVVLSFLSRHVLLTFACTTPVRT